jgi:predicted HTH domain antitoxin
MSLVIPDEIAQATHMSPDELRVEIAVLLFKEDKLTLGQAARFVGMPQPHFQHLL